MPVLLGKNRGFFINSLFLSQSQFRWTTQNVQQIRPESALDDKINQEHLKYGKPKSKEYLFVAFEFPLHHKIKLSTLLISQIICNKHLPIVSC